MISCCDLPSQANGLLNAGGSGKQSLLYIGESSFANGENEIVFSKIRGLPVGVGGKGGIDPIAFLASSSALSDVFHSVL